MKTRSRNAISETPTNWQHVNIIDGLWGYRLTSGIFDSLIGFQNCAAAKILKADELTLEEALTYGMTLEKWLQQQEKRKRERE